MAYATKSVLGKNYSMSLSEDEAKVLFIISQTTGGNGSTSPVKHLRSIGSALATAGVTYDSKTPERVALSKMAHFADYPPVETFDAGTAYMDDFGRTMIRSGSNDGWIDTTGLKRSDGWAVRPLRKLVTA